MSDKQIGNTIQATSSSLPTLEIEELDGKDEDAGEKQHPQEENRANGSQKFVPESKSVLKIILHSCRWSSDYSQLSCVIAKLRSHEPVYGPCQGTEPVVPDPPGRNRLLQQKTYQG